jgi:hypothetical protein
MEPVLPLSDECAGGDSPFSLPTTSMGWLSVAGSLDLRQRLGQCWWRDGSEYLFYFYAYDQQARNFPAISTPNDPHALTPTQRALLGNRGVTPAKVNAALNYLESLTGTIARRQDRTVVGEWTGGRRSIIG